jgi:hypothetical protein
VELGKRPQWKNKPVWSDRSAFTSERLLLPESPSQKLPSVLGFTLGRPEKVSNR